MPLGRRMADFNRRLTNRLVLGPAAHLPGFGVVLHVGRRSGRRYRTPVNLFSTDDRYVVALTYGRDAEWVKNLRAAGGCEIVTRGKTVRLGSPRIYRDERRAAVPPPVRLVLRLVRVADFLELRRAEG
jgi:deazaflavin-dependent oxidoreductase (nitroreductase family)